MSKRVVRIPASAGKFRKDVYEKATKIVRQYSVGFRGYRAFGDGPEVWRGIETKSEKALRAMAKVAISN